MGGAPKDEHIVVVLVVVLDLDRLVRVPTNEGDDGFLRRSV